MQQRNKEFMINTSLKSTVIMKTKRALLSLAIAATVCSGAYARENIGTHAKSNVNRALATGCAVDAGAAFMQINNIRARIMDEGDMWWDPGVDCPVTLHLLPVMYAHYLPVLYGLVVLMRADSLKWQP
jgi:hypothetical protein